MRNLAMEGLYKLLMACRITSSALLSRLILMWYSPVTGKYALFVSVVFFPDCNVMHNISMIFLQRVMRHSVNL